MKEAIIRPMGGSGNLHAQMADHIMQKQFQREFITPRQKILPKMTRENPCSQINQPCNHEESASQKVEASTPAILIENIKGSA